MKIVLVLVVMGVVACGAVPVEQGKSGQHGGKMGHGQPMQNKMMMKNRREAETPVHEHSKACNHTNKVPESEVDANNTEVDSAMTREEGEMEMSPVVRETGEGEMETAPMTREAEDEKEMSPMTRETMDEMEMSPMTREAEEGEMEMSPMTRKTGESEMEMAPMTRETGEAEMEQRLPMTQEAGDNKEMSPMTRETMD